MRESKTIERYGSVDNSHSNPDFATLLYPYSIAASWWGNEMLPKIIIIERTPGFFFICFVRDFSSSSFSRYKNDEDIYLLSCFFTAPGEFFGFFLTFVNDALVRTSPFDEIRFFRKGRHVCGEILEPLPCTWQWREIQINNFFSFFLGGAFIIFLWI
jgi:hypothetical protein